MKKIELFEHNEKAYDLLIESSKNNKCTTINHATGTGKSFIILKYLYEHRDKKYLYIAPTYPILEQLLKSCYKIGITPKDLNIDTMIYRTLLQLDMNELYQKYDGFIFDEYHRSGAKKTYVKMKQLKLLLQNSDDEKRFIGLTATPIRYLDDERNMTQEIFDGNVASSLSLSQAMLEELLPVPLYINSKIACRGELNKSSKRVARLAPSKEKTELERKIQQLGKKINNGENDITRMINHYIKGKNGKYIIFCDTIDTLERIYERVDLWFSKFGKIKKYQVHSNMTDQKGLFARGKARTSKEINQDNLDAFNDDKEGISVLLCVDILNEGVHVDGIDGVFLLRRTKSPIIYFQQIGRALSFSGRHKQIKIFDLVNNFGNHSAIESVYMEFQEEMKRMIELYPEKAEQYQAILDRFKIMDETKDILEEINEINEQASPEKIIASKINYSLNLLKNKINSSLETFHIFGDEETEKAYSTIAKYYRYVDNEQFKQLLDLNILLPEELSMSYEERIEQLAGYNSLKEKDEAENDLCIESVIEFVIENDRRPSLDSNEETEKNLAQRYLNCIANLSKEQKEKICNFLEKNNCDFMPWEKVLFDKKVYEKDIEEIIIIAKNCLNENQSLPEYLQRAIINITINYNIEQNTILFSIIEQSDKIESDIRKQKNEERFKKISKIIEVLEENADLDEQELQELGIIDKILNLRQADRDYVRKKYSSIKGKKYYEIIKGKENSQLSDFCKKMKTIQTDEIDNYYSMIEQDQEMYATLKGIIEFMAKNGGKLPNKKSKDNLERLLASKLEIYLENGSILPHISNLERDMQSEWYSPEKIFYSVILEEYKEKEIKLVILKTIDFFNKHGHRPLKNSQDEEERLIAMEYEKMCINGIRQDIIDILNRVFNKKKNIHKTCDAYISNLLASQEERN